MYVLHNVVSAQLRSDLRRLVRARVDEEEPSEILRMIELHARCLRVEHAFYRTVKSDPFALGLASKRRTLTARGRALRRMVRVVSVDSVEQEDHIVEQNAVVQLRLAAPLTLRFHFRCAPATGSRAGRWRVLYKVSFSRNHQRAYPVLVARVKARTWHPTPDGDEIRVRTKDSTLASLARELEVVGFGVAETLLFLLMFDLYDEEWDLANAVCDVLEEVME